MECPTLKTHIDPGKSAKGGFSTPAPLTAVEEACLTQNIVRVIHVYFFVAQQQLIADFWRDQTSLLPGRPMQVRQTFSNSTSVYQVDSSRVTSLTSLQMHGGLDDDLIEPQVVIESSD